MPLPVFVVDVASGKRRTNRSGLVERLIKLARHRELRQDIAAILLIAASILIFYFQPLFGRDTVIPYDLVSQHFMYQSYDTKTLSDGVFPLWSPFLLGGYPSYADPLSAVFYPPNLLAAMTSDRGILSLKALEWQVAAHLFLAGLGTYLLAMRVTGYRFGSVIAALSLILGGFMATHGPHLSALSTLSWFPLIALTLDRGLINRNLGWSVLSGTMFGVAILAGHAQAGLHIAYILTAFSVYRLLGFVFRGQRKEAVQSLANAAAFYVIAFGLAAVQFLPSYEYGEVAGRSYLGYVQAAYGSMSPAALVTLVVPDFFSYDITGKYWGPRDPAETYIYLGLFPIIFAAAALSLHRRSVMILLTLAGIALLMALGSYTYVHRLAYTSLPFFDKIARPFNAIFFFQFSLSVLAAFGARSLFSTIWTDPRLLEQVAGIVKKGTLIFASFAVGILVLSAYSPDQDRSLRLQGISNAFLLSALLMGCLLVLLALRRRLTNNLWLLKTAVLAMIVLDLLTFGSGKVFNTGRAAEAFITPDGVYDERNEIIRFLKADDDYFKNNYFRIYPYQAGILWANGEDIWQIFSISGYHGMRLTSYERVMGLIPSFDSRLLDMLNVKYFVLPKLINEMNRSVKPNEYSLVFDGWPKVYRNPDFLPRAYLVYRSVTAADDEEALGMLGDPAFDPASTIILEGSAPHPTQDANAGGVGAARIISYSSNRIEIEATTSTPGYLFTSEFYYPGWRVYVDGTEDRVLKANFAFRGVFMPSGSHRVVFDFDPGIFKAGAAISLGTAMVVFAVLFWWLIVLVHRVRAKGL